MTVRIKLSLLITIVGLISSLIFSVIIFVEMKEQPYQLIDSELKKASDEMFSGKNDIGLIIAGIEQNNTTDINGRQPWLKVYDLTSGKLIYRSYITTLFDLQEPPSAGMTTSGIRVNPDVIDLGQVGNERIPFRLNSFIYNIAGKSYRVCIGRPMEQLQNEIREIFFEVFRGLVISIVILIIFSFVISGLILKPVRNINNLVREISEKHMDQRIPVGKEQDEFNSLARALNNVFERLENAFKKQKQFLADASHELKTPLTLVRLSLDELTSSKEEFNSGFFQEKTQLLTRHVYRMERLVKDLLDLSAIELGDPDMNTKVDLEKMLTNLIIDYRQIAELRGISIEGDISGPLVVYGNEEFLFRAFSNIFDNAVKYNIKDGSIEVKTAKSGSEIIITVSNTGPGISPENIEKVFEEFFRVEQSRSLKYGGSGLGLALVKRKIELHGGTVTIQSRPDELTAVITRLPSG